MGKIKYFGYFVSGAITGFIWGFILKYGIELTQEGITWLITEELLKTILHNPFIVAFVSLLIFVISTAIPTILSIYYLKDFYEEDEKAFWFGVLGFGFMVLAVLNIMSKLSALFLVVAIFWAILEKPIDYIIDSIS